MLQVLIAARLARTVVMAPQSVGPVRSSFGQKVIASVLRRVDRAFVREQSSVDFVESLYGKLPANVVFSGDLAFWYRRPEQNIDADWRALGVDPARPIIGMTILEWSFPLAADPEAAEMAYLRALSRLVDRAIADDYQIVIFNQVSSDLKAIDKFVAINDKAIVDRGSRSCGKLARMIAQCEIFIGSRFHSCIFGLIGSVPTGAIAYLPKTTGIMKDLGLSAYVRSIDDITPEIVDALYDELLSNRATISNSVRAAVAGYRRGNGAFVDFLSDMAGDAAPNRKRTDDAVPSAEQL
jgi:colanic acid/amylovoran biosynthesis protein